MKVGFLRTKIASSYELCFWNWTHETCAGEVTRYM